MRIEVPASAQCIGADRFVLYEIADCEIHLFVEANVQKHVQRLYWVQFEGYRPSKPELASTYDSPRHAQIGALDFFVDTWITPRMHNFEKDPTASTCARSCARKATSCHPP